MTMGGPITLGGPLIKTSQGDSDATSQVSEPEVSNLEPTINGSRQSMKHINLKKLLNEQGMFISSLLLILIYSMQAPRKDYKVPVKS